VGATGGFRRRAAFIRQQRQAAEHVLLFDTGDALIGGGLLGDQTKGEAIVAGMNLMGYDAMALGPKELSLGSDELSQRIEESDFPMLSANVVLTGTQTLLAAPYTVQQVGDHRVGVIGLTRSPTEPLAGFRVLDPEQSAAHYVPEVAEQADMVVILTNMSYREALVLVGDVPGVDLLIAALPDEPPSQAVRVPGTATIAVTAEQPAAGHTGRWVGRLQVSVEGDGALDGESWKSTAMDSRFVDDLEMQALLDKYRQ
jgi:2',3'-cyclic-nucleotide 2'-phosphodiesterase (5'-nucleotidase family)